MPGAAIIIRCQNHDVGTTTTGTGGLFAVGALRGGNYTIVAAGTAAGYRLWAPGTAPPAARDAALVVADGRVVRGQCDPCGGCGQCSDCSGRGRGRVLRLLKNPWVVATLIGAAIAIPLAAADDDDDSAS